MSEIRVEGLRKQFPTRPPLVALQDESFTVTAGELLVLLGPSGCGKTTMLRCLAGLETPDRGEISLGGRVVYSSDGHVNVPPHRRDIGLVFQSFALWPHLSARANIAFPLRARKVARSKRDGLVDEIARLVELDSALLAKAPGQLSGGQQQRVALARALVSQPSVVLFDEPLSNLDAFLRDQLRHELRALHRRIGFTGVFVTHDLTEAATVADRIAVMEVGRIVQNGSPADVFERPSTAGVARLVGARPLCTLRRHGGGWSSDIRGENVTVPIPVDGPDEVTAFARPDRVRLVADAAPAPSGAVRLGHGIVRDSVTTGSEVDYLLELPGRELRLTVLRRGASVLPIGADAAVEIDECDVLYFDPADGGAVGGAPQRTVTVAVPSDPPSLASSADPEDPATARSQAR